LNAKKIRKIFENIPNFFKTAKTNKNMQNLKILNSKEVKRVRKLLNEQFGFDEKLTFVFMLSKKGKLYIINRDIEKIDFEKLRIDSAGLYFGKLSETDLRLSIEGSQIIGPKANKNILEINNLEFKKWLRGLDFNINSSLNGFVIVKHKEDFIGCGKMNKNRLLNYVPKSRRLININN